MLLIASSVLAPADASPDSTVEHIVAPAFRADICSSWHSIALPRQVAVRSVPRRRCCWRSVRDSCHGCWFPPRQHLVAPATHIGSGLLLPHATICSNSPQNVTFLCARALHSVTEEEDCAAGTLEGVFLAKLPRLLSLEDRSGLLGCGPIGVHRIKVSLRQDECEDRVDEFEGCLSCRRRCTASRHGQLRAAALRAGLECLFA